ncbi:MAG: hypothetical protein U0836_04425 [Pirellulales bacterium]
MKPSFSLKWPFVVMAIVGLAITSLANANTWWVTSASSAYCTLLLAAAFYALLWRDAFCIGVVIVAVFRLVCSLNSNVHHSFLSEELIDEIVRRVFDPDGLRDPWSTTDAETDYERAVTALLTLMWSAAVCVSGGFLARAFSERAKQGDGVRQSRIWFLAGGVFVGLAAVSLLNANAWWVTSLRSVYCGLLVAAAFLSLWRSNAFCTGVVIVGALRELVSLNAFPFISSFVSDDVIRDILRMCYDSDPDGGIDGGVLDYWRAVSATLTLVWSTIMCVLGGVVFSAGTKLTEARKAKP